ncbi:hypothetical protein [Candidatus Nitrospira allomarina]|uniref:Uncharacterized protein n=1 Tax=Candidatus Nitrospira allomarina TaxID=3020900 RepID=A0AA96GH80_9BACT|nr:hypothetical protein [Candidatus Nitrospira allomarina]WNM57671.1 hypothetical protein PP769_17130 [Candidatus Nitrospira allomarina]
MERRVTSHTEEEEMNQRRRLLTLARKGDQKAVESLFELYQVRVFSGDALKKKKLPSFPLPTPTGTSGKGTGKGVKKLGKNSRASPGDMTPAPLPHNSVQESKMKSGLPIKKIGKVKGAKPTDKKPVQTAPKVGKNKKSVPGGKSKKTSALSARPARVKKK